MTKLITHGGHFQRSRPTEAAFVMLVALVHVALLRLMLDASVKPRIIDPRSSPTIATWNILASSEAPLARSAPDPKASAVSVDVDAPTVVTEELPPVAAGLGAAFASDPYAGAAPVGDGFAKPVTAPDPVRRPQAAVPAGDDPFSLWLTDLRARLAPTLAAETSPLKSVRAEVLAQPTGGFTSARIAQGSGDLAVDRQILVDVMHHQELVERGMVAAPRWFTFPAIDLAPTPDKS